MKLKPGAQLAGADLRLRKVLVVADRVWKNHNQELVVTSGLDGEHSAGSLHYYGLAADFRTRFFSKEEIEKVAEELKTALLGYATVVIEPDHIHVHVIV